MPAGRASESDSRGAVGKRGAELCSPLIVGDGEESQKQTELVHLEAHHLKEEVGLDAESGERISACQRGGHKGLGLSGSCPALSYCMPAFASS